MLKVTQKFLIKQIMLIVRGRIVYRLNLNRPSTHVIKIVLCKNNIIAYTVVTLV